MMPIEVLITISHTMAKSITILTEGKLPTKLTRNTLIMILLGDGINMDNQIQRDRFKDIIINILLTCRNCMGQLSWKIVKVNTNS